MCANKKIEKIEYYGVEMTSLEGFKFSVFSKDPNYPAMNTLTREERFNFTKDWLKNLRSNELTEKKIINTY